MGLIGYVVGNRGIEEVTIVMGPEHVNDIRLFDYVVYEYGDYRVLAQIVDITRSLYTIGSSIAPNVFSSGIRPLETILAKLLVIGRRSGGTLKLPDTPPPVGTPVYKASPEVVKAYLGLKGSLCIGRLLALKDVEVCLNEEGLSRHMAIIGATGNGKTWTSIVLIEELLKLGATIVVIDTHGEYVKAKDSVKKLGNGAGVSVFKASKVHEGDYMYRVGLASTNPEHLMMVMGINDRAIRVREAFAMVYKALKYASKVYEDQSLLSPRNIELILGHVVSGRKIINVESLGKILGKGYLTNEIKDNEYFEKLQSALKDLSSIVEDRGMLTAAAAALRYVRRLRRLGVYSYRHTPLSKILKPRHVSIINLAGLDDSVMDHVVYDLLTRIIKARVNYVRNLPGPQYPYPVVVIVEEAHRFASRNEDTLSSEVLLRIAKEGRKFGVFLVLVTQRPIDMDPGILSQIQNYIILKMVNPRYRETLFETSEFMNETLDKVISSLNKGEALVIGPIVGSQIPILVEVRRKILEYGGGDINIQAYWSINPPSSASTVGRNEEQALRSSVEKVLRVKVPSLLFKKASLLLGKVVVESTDGKVIRGYVNNARVEFDQESGTWSCSICGESKRPCEHVIALVLKDIEVKKAEPRH